MQNLKKVFLQGLLALAVLAHGAAHAGPTYHVSLDTTGYTGQALMDFTFLANAGATPATAVLDHFSGAFGATFDRSAGASGVIPGGVTLGNQGGGDYLTQFVQLGGLFSFDVRFDGDFATTEAIDESQFNATLYNASLTGYIGNDGSFAQFVLVPQVNGMQGGVLASSPTGQARVAPAAAVPEPASSSLTLGALAMLGLVRGRRRVAG